MHTLHEGQPRTKTLYHKLYVLLRMNHTQALRFLPHLPVQLNGRHSACLEVLE